MAKLTEIEGIGEFYAEKLREIGIPTTDSLLERGSTPAGRKAIAEKAGISGKLVLEWVNRADLFRIKGVAEEYADLLEEAGVDTVPELAQRDAASLHETMGAVNARKKLVRALPAPSIVADWIEQAKKLPRVLKY
jgi:predicted flap endonuclease-1-like 5' DNA nuclease